MDLQSCRLAEGISNIPSCGHPLLLLYNQRYAPALRNSQKGKKLHSGKGVAAAQYMPTTNRAARTKEVYATRCMPSISRKEERNLKDLALFPAGAFQGRDGIA
jgi:hypothetical protein